MLCVSQNRQEFFDDFVTETTKNNPVNEGKDAQMAPGTAPSDSIFSTIPQRELSSLP